MVSHDDTQYVYKTIHMILWVTACGINVRYVRHITMIYTTTELLIHLTRTSNYAKKGRRKYIPVFSCNVYRHTAVADKEHKFSV